MCVHGTREETDEQRARECERTVSTDDLGLDPMLLHASSLLWSIAQLKWHNAHTHKSRAIASTYVVNVNIYDYTYT